MSRAIPPAQRGLSEPRSSVPARGRVVPSPARLALLQALADRQADAENVAIPPEQRGLSEARSSVPVGEFSPPPLSLALLQALADRQADAENVAISPVQRGLSEPRGSGAVWEYSQASPGSSSSETMPTPSATPLSEPDESGAVLESSPSQNAESALEKLEKGLAEWKQTQPNIDNANKAVERILSAYIDRKSKLNLSHLELSSLPAEIGQLTQLRKLNLSYNSLNTLPPEIGQLCQLTRLNLDDNKLSSLPAEIWQLTELQKLRLSDNSLNTLPPEIGNLSNLKDLRIMQNPALSELPMSLGQIPDLTHLSIDGTLIPREQRDGILESCKALRDAIAAEQLKSKINMWKTFAVSTVGINTATFSDVEKGQIYEWLTRLESAADFSRCQKELAGIVCHMMVDLTTMDKEGEFKHKEFKDSFFNILAASLESCQDRAAMTLNELYTSWKLECNHSGDKQDTLKLMSGLAKTLTLRDAVANKISAMEGAGANMGESVQIFLYCESKLKEPLQLVTAIENMEFSDYTEDLMKKVEEEYYIKIDLPKLKEQVEKNHHRKMAGFPKIRTLWENDKNKESIDFDTIKNRVRSKMEKLEESHQTKIENLEREYKNESSQEKLKEKHKMTAQFTLDYESQSKTLMDSYNNPEIEAIANWAQAQLRKGTVN